MVSHFLLLALFACFVSLVMSVLLRDDPREQFRLGLLILGGFVGAAVLLGWLLYPLPV